MVPDVILQLIYGVDGHAVDARTDDGGGHIEGGVHRKPHLVKVEILQQRMAQITHADHHKMVMIIHAQNMSDLGAQLLHIIAVTLLSKFSETAEILPDLRGGDVHLLPQGM